jgi:hypothetical protein
MRGSRFGRQRHRLDRHAAGGVPGRRFICPPRAVRLPWVLSASAMPATVKTQADSICQRSTHQINTMIWRFMNTGLPPRCSGQRGVREQCDAR